MTVPIHAKKKRIKRIGRMRKRAGKCAAFLLAALLLLETAACGAGNGEGIGSEPQGTVSSSSKDSSDQKTSLQPDPALLTADSGYTKEDLETEYNETDAVYITLSGDTAQIEGSGASFQRNAGAHGSTLQIEKAGAYILTGELRGSIRVQAGKNDSVRIILKNVSVVSEDGPAIYGEQSGHIYIVLPAGTENSLIDGEACSLSEEDSQPWAALFSKDDLTINGEGCLTVKGQYQNGIGSKDDLIITGGVLNVTAKEHGLRGRDSVRICGGSLTINAGADGIQTNNDTDSAKGFIYIDGGEFSITAENDGLQAETLLRITAGSFQITTGGGSENGEKEKNQEQAPPMDGFFGQKRNPMEGGTVPQRPEGMESLPEGVQLPFDMQEGSFPEGSFPAGSAPEPSQGKEPGNFPGNQQNEGENSSVFGSPGEKAPESMENISSSSDGESRKGLKAGGYLLITGGDFQLDCADDALHTNGECVVSGGTLTLQTGDDGIHADGNLIVSDGTLHIKKSYEGLEGLSVAISGGNIDITSSDDGINASGGSSSEGTAGGFKGGFNGEFGREEADENIYIRFTGGFTKINASGDGVDSNGNLYMEDGVLFINGPTSGGDGALDYAGTASVSGGITIAAGSLGMAENYSAGSQPSLLYTFESLQEAETLVSLCDGQGNCILSFRAEKAFQTVVFSAPELKEGEKVSIYIGGSSDSLDENGFASGGRLTGAQKEDTVTLSSQILSAGASWGNKNTGGFGGGPGGNGRR